MILKMQKRLSILLTRARLKNNRYHTYRSFDGKCKNMLDLHFCDISLQHFNDFQVSEDLSSDHKFTIATMNLRKGKIFQLRAKINSRKFEKTYENYADHQISGL